MPQALSSDVEAELRAAFSRGIDDLRSGHNMPIGGLVLYRDVRERRFIVSCFAPHYYIENIRRQDAEERIATAKVELTTLVGLFPELHDLMHDLDLSFQFCHDDGKLAVCIAKEEHGKFRYF